MLQIGITGSMGSGKTTVAEMLQEFGIPVIDVDLAGRWAIERNATVRRKLRQVFGAEFFDGDQLDRRKMGDKVFSDPEALRALNTIVHPVMLQRVRDLMAREKDASRHSPYLVVDAALLFELQLDQEMDLIVTVTAPLQQRIARACSKNGLTAQQVRQRNRVQLSQSEKARRSDIILPNDSTLKVLQGRVKRLHLKLLARSHEI